MTVDGQMIVGMLLFIAFLIESASSHSQASLGYKGSLFVIAILVLAHGLFRIVAQWI